ncbi:galactokinase [Streptoalloteichus tenebrarius]|uniref:Galactokinase n=1 Tax=Streptoalloteichus tenebrarius (strain ATCC 17920 / DSM 40477 / JCM 4838 / CBS 697.72 / NBRC 16177 / NCIMB 11028 / NRRL B-12390 / A12253. 1 / ISP 5477) TaxID=1933 RepID=A0ABT1HMS8_STRSD|nr:galactokinase [Streptoalloteichus tenebrarius]MCP2256808.1 galactokinase [Streptoalloteichus tenebrarius]BFF00284.1 galactokinase [Streptoalloteichus tenebrarius]
MRPGGRAAAAFAAEHGRAPDSVWSAPGRVNLIGEHTDYNDGFVLPFALPHRTAAAVGRRTDGVLAVATLGEDGVPRRAEPVRIADLAPGGVSGWAAYPAGVAWALRGEGVPLTGADVMLASDVPTGAGLSSSHALECAVALALLDLAGLTPDSEGSPSRDEVARWVQRAENDFVGAPTGLLDQTASLRCASEHVLFLDVRSGHGEQVPFDAARDELAVLVIDTRASHSLSESGYGDRRRGCERAAELLGVPALRDVGVEELPAATDRLPEELRPLVRHVVTENERVLATVAALRAGRLAEVGPLLTASHTSLRDDYRVSCEELDVAVEAALNTGALGARMTGGGFGGSAIALVSTSKLDAVEHAVTEAYAARGFTAPRLFTAVPSAGAGRED